MGFFVLSLIFEANLSVRLLINEKPATSRIGGQR